MHRLILKHRALVQATSAVERLRARMRVPPVPAALLVVLACAIVYETVTVVRIHGYNQSIFNPSAQRAGEEDPPQLIFATAFHLDQQGHYQDALRLYNSLEHHSNPALREKVKYNMGTIYLREAAQLWNSEGVKAYARVNTLLELAEAAYRKVLQLNDQNWDARYNLEYALSIRPPGKTVDKADWKGRKSSVYSIFPGIPGGGP